jgi:hypothetical protein
VTHGDQRRPSAGADTPHRRVDALLPLPATAGQRRRAARTVCCVMAAHGDEPAAIRDVLAALDLLDPPPR